MPDMTKQLALEFKLAEKYVQNVINLIDEGNTIPFIARYRKELTGSLDDQVLRELADRLIYLRNLEKRREEVRASIIEQGKMTDELEAALNAAQTLAEIEDIYRPFRPKRRTRATIAREKGLEPLAEIIFAQTLRTGDIMAIAAEYIDAEKGVERAEDAIAGASDIIAEDISDNAELRKELRAYIFRYGVLTSKQTRDEDSVYSMYYDYTEAVNKVQSHRMLAMNRGERDEFLSVSITADAVAALDIIREGVITDPLSITAGIVMNAAEDAYKRLLFPSLERELRSDLTDTASGQAIKMFSLNLKHLLMQPPVRGRVTLGLDPAYRTGCKIAVVDGTGKVLDTTVVYPTPPHNKTEESKTALKKLIKKHNVSAIAIGNGTASREAEIFVAELIKELSGKIEYMVVNEAGASVYSASKLAAAEFPEFDVSLRSAVSISRRLQDPLAELVKIDPKSIGVGQYQHDMPEARLGEALGGVVEDCVNSVGVDLNTASVSLLKYVSGLSAPVAANIVACREEKGIFKSRSQLKKVPKLGPKTFVQCAGFLRVPDSDDILDNTSVHPESYDAARKLLELCDYSLADVREGRLGELRERVSRFGEADAAEYCGVGIPTLRDVCAELLKPGRDPRDELPPPLLRTDVMSMDDLKPGMELTGTVRNVIDFGAFIDIGVHQDGLVHISEICDRFIRHPSEALKLGDIVKVRVLSVDIPKKRISLTMKMGV